MLKIVLVIGLFVAGNANGQSLRSILINPPSTDNGLEYIEIQAGANQTLSNRYVLIIEGDASSQGVIDLVINLGSYTTGSNGLLLIRDSPTAISPAPDAQTSVVILDFNPDIENGSNTYLIVESNIAPIVGTDLDTNNDGILETTPWTTVNDALGVSDSDPSDIVYGASLSGANISSTTIAFVYKIGSTWNARNVSGTSPGPFTLNSTNPQLTLTPGSTVGPVAIILPIIINNYALDMGQNEITILWTTLSETNNSHFTIDHSTDGSQWSEIGRVEAALDRNNGKEYAFEHNNPTQGINYYRLNQFDLDGTKTTFDVLAGFMNTTKEDYLFPTITHDKIYLSSGKEGLVKIFDATGKMVLIQNYHSGNAINVDNLSKGQYFLNHSESTLPFIKE